MVLLGETDYQLEEMMADSLTSLVKKHGHIPVHIKFSIVHDVSLGLCYLHNHYPPIVCRDLSPNNILLTAHYVAKIGDFGVAKALKADSDKTMTKAPGTLDFMAPESLSTNPVYGIPMDVFSFAGMVLHTFNQVHPIKLNLIQVLGQWWLCLSLNLISNTFKSYRKRLKCY